MKSRVYLTSSAVTLLFALATAAGAGCGHDASGGSPPRLPFPCDDPGPLKVAGEETGFDFCTGGPVYRAKAQACPSNLSHHEARMCQSSGSDRSCTADTQCNEAPNGFCDSIPASSVCFCQYGCTTDADCASGSICLCGEPVGRCVSASCTSNADCKEGSLCAEYTLDPSCGGGVSFACQDDLDECQTDADCEVGTTCSVQWEPADGTSPHRVCSRPGCQS